MQMSEPRQRKTPGTASSATSPDIQGTPSPQLPGADYSYTVELVARIENQLGKLTEAVTSLKETTKEHGTELRAIGKDVHAARVVTVFVGAFLQRPHGQEPKERLMLSVMTSHAILSALWYSAITANAAACWRYRKSDLFWFRIWLGVHLVAELIGAGLRDHRRGYYWFATFAVPVTTTLLLCVLMEAVALRGRTVALAGAIAAVLFAVLHQPVIQPQFWTGYIEQGVSIAASFIGAEILIENARTAAGVDRHAMTLALYCLAVAVVGYGHSEFPRTIGRASEGVDAVAFGLWAWSARRAA